LGYTMSEKGKKGRISWTTVKIPKDLNNILNEYVEKLNLAKHKIIAKSLQFFVEQQKKPKIKKDLPMIDKISWYIIKISMSVGRFKENPTNANLDALIRTSNQVTERVGVDTTWVIRTAEAYLKKQDSENSQELNSALKNVVITMMNKLFEYYEGSENKKE